MRALPPKRSLHARGLAARISSHWKQSLSAVLLLSACGITDGEPCGQEQLCFGPNKRDAKGQILVYNNGAEPQQLDPGLATGTPDGRIIDELFEGLTDYHPETLKPVPGVAERVDQSPDKRHFVFHLRKDAKWSNGDPVTAHDFVYSWERVLNPVTAAQYAYILNVIENGEQYTLETVRLTLGAVEATNESPEPTLPLAARQIVSLEDSNAARLKGAAKLASSAGAEQSGASLEKDQIVLITNRKALDKPGGKPDEKEVWLEVDAYNINIEDPTEVKGLSSATANHGWLKAEQVAAFFPSSNRRVLANQEPLRKKPQGDIVKTFDTREEVNIPAGEEVKIIFMEGDHAKVYWAGKARYGYLKTSNLLNPWGEIYRFKVKPQTKEKKEVAPPAPTPAPTPASAPTSEPGSAPSSAPAPEPAPIITPKPAAAIAESGWVLAKDLLMEPSVLGVKAVDEHTLDVQLKSPTSYFLSLLAHYTYRPIHPATFEEWGLEWTKPEHIVGNGPFVLKYHKRRDRFEMEKSQTYWDKDVVTLEKVIAYSMDDLNTTLMMYKAGYTDLIVANDMPAPYVPMFYDYEKAEPIRADFKVSPSLGTYFYRLNTTREPFDDVKVRKALAMALDRNKIPKAIRIPVKPADSITPPDMPDTGYNPPDGPNFNVAEAKKLLAEAGFPDGKGFPTISILFNTQEQHKTIAEIVQAQWTTNLGINVTLENKEWKTYLDATQSLNYSVARAGWIADYSDPMTFLDMWITGGGNNNTGWSNKEYDAMISAAQAEADPEKRRQIMTKMETMLNEEMPFVPIYTYVWFAMTKPYVKNYFENMQDKHPLKWVCVETSMIGESSSPVCAEAEARLKNEKGL